MKLLLLSDMHLTSSSPIARKDNVLDAGLSKLIYVLNYAEDNNAYILQTGDFCDKSRDWNLLLQLLKIFRKFSNIPGLFTIHGQHDYYYRSKNPSTMNILGMFNNKVKLLSKPSQINKTSTDWIMSPMSWGDKMPEPIKGKKNILIAHTQLHPIKTYPGQEVTTLPKIRKLLKKWDIMLVGDIHQNVMVSQGSNYFINTGPMVRLEATSYNMTHEPCFYLYDTRTKEIKRKVIPHEPSGKVLNTDHLDIAEDTMEDLKINELAEAMQRRFKGNPTSEKLQSELKKSKIKKSVRNIIMETWNDSRTMELK